MKMETEFYELTWASQFFTRAARLPADETVRPRAAMPAILGFNLHNEKQPRQVLAAGGQAEDLSGGVMSLHALEVAQRQHARSEKYKELVATQGTIAANKWLEANPVLPPMQKAPEGFARLMEIASKPEHRDEAMAIACEIARKIEPTHIAAHDVARTIINLRVDEIIDAMAADVSSGGPLADVPVVAPRMGAHVQTPDEVIPLRQVFRRMRNERSNRDAEQFIAEQTADALAVRQIRRSQSPTARQALDAVEIPAGVIRSFVKANFPELVA
jgi:hypothetical protein